MRLGNRMADPPPYADHICLWRDALADWVPDRLFDAHVHLVPPEAVGPYSAERLAEGLCRFGSLTWEEYDGLHAGLFAGKRLAGLAAFGLPVREVDFERANAYIRRLMQREPRVRGLALAHPTDAASTQAELDRARAGGAPFAGVKPYFDFLGKSNYETTMPEFIPEALLGRLDADGLVLMLHTSGRGMGEPENQAYVRRVLDRFPGVRIVLAHMGRYLEVDEFFRFADSGLLGHPNLYLDTSYVTDREVYARTLKNPETRDRLLFGADMPYGLMAGEPDAEAAGRRGPDAPRTYNVYHAIHAFKQALESVVADADQAEAIKRRVFHDNAASLFSDPTADPPKKGTPDARG